MDLGIRNAEGYYDLTVYEAIKKISKEEEIRKKLIYVCSPFRGDEERNIKRALRYCQFVVAQGYVPIATHLLFPQFMDDNDYHERKIALNMAMTVLSRCDELWNFGLNVSDGMLSEIEKAKLLHKKVRYFTRECKEVRI